VFCSQRSTAPVGTDRPRQQGPRPDDWLLLTDADRAMAGIGAALDRTSRWQGDAE
jgi:hypothetical protein